MSTLIGQKFNYCANRTMDTIIHQQMKYEGSPVYNCKQNTVFIYERILK